MFASAGECRHRGNTITHTQKQTNTEKERKIEQKELPHSEEAVIGS